ncbi:MAG TPA: serine/threonine-protein kinase [Polyangia bacterium]|nr:serine/threonine-protein kinase [Polyangia bacterium]
MHETNRYPRPFGKYLLLRQLAIGGMAEVYLARQSGPAGFEKECVIKRILPALAADQQFVSMFLDEARIAARLSHPNIVQIYDLGSVAEGDYFLAMEHVHGVDLQQIEEAETARGGRMPLAVAVRIVSNVAEGLEHAHRATDGRGAALGLVHRDVTPSNVIVSFDGVAKILDFGIAKAVAKKGRTEVGVIKGKIPYMSPEQVQGDALDSRSDIFSLGTVLYELTTGHKPFDGEGPADLSLKILQTVPKPPSVYVDGYPVALTDIVRQAMSKTPTERFRSARDMHEALEEFLLVSGIRCTSHDVAAYIDGLFPGLRDKTREAAESLPIEVTDPTVPMLQVRGTDPGQRDLRPGSAGDPPLVMGDLSSPSLGSYEDQRRTRGGGGGRGGGSTVVVVLLVVAVAFGFWFFATRSGGESAASKTTAPTTTTPPATATATTPSGVAAKPAKPAKTMKPTELAVPSVNGDTAKTPATPASSTKVATTDKPVKAEPKHHEHHAAKPTAHGAVGLPHLPTPPPPDDNP